MKFLRILLMLLAISAATQAARADLSDNPLHNYSNRLDVDNNGKVNPRDLLLVINHITQPTAEGFAVPLSAGPTYFWDTNNDDRVSPIDALLVINNLSQTPEPSTMIMAGIGAALLAGAAWRRKRTA